MKTRIILQGGFYKIQIRFLWFFWRTIQRPEDLDEKDFGGDMCFIYQSEAERYVKYMKDGFEVVSK